MTNDPQRAQMDAANRHNYARLDAILTEAGFAEHAHFLNWGYAPVKGIPDWATGPAPGDGANALHERLVAELIGPCSLNGKRVLDVGCGRGGMLAHISRRFRPLSISGLDISAENVASARRMLASKGVRLQIADACSLPYGDASQDVVLNLESSGAYANIVRFFAHVHRVLVFGGQFLYGDVWPRSLLSELERLMYRLGFEMEELRDITEQVLAARALAPTSIMTRLKDVDADFIGELEAYFAFPGSAMWNCMQQGHIAYILSRWRRNQKLATTKEETGGPGITNLRRQFLNECLVAAQARLDVEQKWFPLGGPKNRAAVNILAFPYAVGGASVFRSWLEQLPENWAFSPVQLPGREHRLNEQPFETIEAATSALMQVIAPYRHVPLALIGWSLGCKIAFELARRMEAEHGAPPLLLMLGACPSPETRITGAISPRDGWRVYLEALGGTPSAVLDNDEMLATLDPVMRGDLAMATAYCSSACLSAPMLMIAAEDDHLVPVDAVKRWQGRTSCSFEFHRMQGGHFLLRDQGPMLATLFASKLKALLKDEQS